MNIGTNFKYFAYKESVPLSAKFHLSQVIHPFYVQGDITLIGANAVPTYGRMADAVTGLSPICAQSSGSRMRSIPAIDAFRQPRFAVGNTSKDASVLPDQSFLKPACSNTQNDEEEGMELFRLLRLYRYFATVRLTTVVASLLLRTGRSKTHIYILQKFDSLHIPKSRNTDTVSRESRIMCRFQRIGLPRGSE